MNITLNENIKQDILRNCSPQEKYIILTNETLQIENKKFIQTINELNNKIKDYEEELDKNDVSKRYVKGLLKNLVEVEKMKTKILKNTQCDFNIIRECYNNNSRINRYIYRIYEAFILIFFGILFQIEFYSFGQFILSISFICSSFAIFERTNKDIIIKNNLENEKLEIKIKNITDSQDFLFDYIDNL